MNNTRFGSSIGRSARRGAALAALLALALPASAWWNDEWTQRKLVTVDASSVGGDAIAGAPVLLRLSDANFDFNAAKPDGSDLRFVAADEKTLLPFSLERFDSTMHEAFVWVKVPDLKAGGRTTFWVYFANAGTKGPVTPDPKSTYEADMALVYHFAERDRPPVDASPAGNNAQTTGVAAEGSIIGPGLRVDGRTTVTIPGSASLFWSEGAAMTWSAWIKPAVLTPNAVVFSRRGDGNRHFLIGLDSGAPFVEVMYQGGRVRSPAGAPVSANTWHHLAVVASAEKLTVYLDGEAYGTAAAPLPALNGPSVAGGDGVGGLMSTGDTLFSGEMDELRIARAARSPGFVKFMALSEGAEGSKVVSVGIVEQPASWFGWMKEGYVGVIIDSLTIDGWVVIVLLAVMSVISWLVMVAKAMLLSRAGKANALFLQQWSELATNLAALDEVDEEKARSLGGRIDAAGHRALRDSPLYRIYHIGVQEIRHRRQSDDRAGASKPLSARSIEAIRASLDGGLVREAEKLSAKMVLLTIAISGGPFLGLLGTVVGVMITFAAVAQAGDVNVNAIAPGIAAALAATVAGLAVAIPALFGYNYLLTRIKGMNNDLHVFIDEFVTKLAEFYSDAVETED